MDTLNTIHNGPDLSRISHISAVPSPIELADRIPVAHSAGQTVQISRMALHSIFTGVDDRLAVIVGPCSVHCPDEALEYARRLLRSRLRYHYDLEIVMRVYFEKPRTRLGWKGLLYDPDLDGRDNLSKGLVATRSLLHAINELGVPAATEFLEPSTTLFVSDLIAWGTVGARTTESQTHRQMASGAPCPVGFKNGTDGNIDIAIDALVTAREPHSFFSVGPDGNIAHIRTVGNSDCHIVLRGGTTPNYSAEHVLSVREKLRQANLPERIVIDVSHGNSSRIAGNQLLVCENIGRQLQVGSRTIAGVMIESNLSHGQQSFAAGTTLAYGKSITDPCIGWDETENVLSVLAQAVRWRRTATHYPLLPSDDDAPSESGNVFQPEPF
ncbi:3-deoxy-7-phosphoheptulonate synthase [Burkholderia pyrrocinia]